MSERKEASGEGKEEGEGDEGRSVTLSFGPSEDSDGESEDELETPASGEAGEIVDLSPEAESEEILEVEADDSGESEKKEPAEGKPFHKHPRWKQLIKDRDGWKERALEGEGERGETQERLDLVEEAVLESYGKFKNPLDQLAADKRWVDAMEELEKTDSVVADSNLRIKAHLEGKIVEEETPQKKTPKPKLDLNLEPAPKRVEKKDTRVDALMNDRLGEKVTHWMTNQARIKPEFLKPLQENVLRKLGPDDLGKLTQDRMKDLTTAAMSDYGWSAKLVQEPRKKRSTTPATPGASSTPAPRSKGKDEPEKKGDPPTGRRTVAKWEQESRDLTRSAMDEVAAAREASS